MDGVLLGAQRCNEIRDQIEAVHPAVRKAGVFNDEAIWNFATCNEHDCRHNVDQDPEQSELLHELGHVELLSDRLFSQLGGNHCLAFPSLASALAFQASSSFHRETQDEV